MSNPESARDGLKKLKEKYALQLPEKIRAIEDAALKMPSSGFEKESIERVRIMAHTLAGSSLSFGFAELGKTARTIEGILKDVINSGKIDDGNRENIFLLLQEMKQFMASPEAEEASAATPSIVEQVPLTAEKKESKRLLYLVENDALLRESLSLQLRGFGYEVSEFPTPVELKAALRETVPSAILIDVVFPGGEKAGIEAVADIISSFEEVPVVFMSEREDLDVRIEAVRAGGRAYFIKPVNIGTLTEKLDALTKDAVSVDPYRVLIVEDDPDLADYYSITLEQAGMKTEVVTDPLGVMDPLIEFNPDLILMDMYMPGCSGIELSKVIRQIESFVSIPIVFLSGETDIDKQLKAMNMGGDDFLTKPIRPEHLISSVCIRAERMRIIRSFMDRDSLTGLLNHSRTKETLDSLFERAKRQKSPLSFAMIDIDKFKSVNDTYGHMTGDRVILSLSRLLRQRLRKTDVVGRYGGEEFAAILHDADAGSARKILDGIRESFSHLRHQSDKGEFASTFSCGIASYPSFDDAKSLIASADAALYDAKRSGRNMVSVANPYTNPPHL